MRFKIDIDCTPQEARTFLGLPDVEPMQRALTEELESRIKANLDLMDPEALLRTWLPGAAKGWEEAIRSFITPSKGTRESSKS